MKEEIQYFNSLEAAKILGVNVSSIKRWTDEGKLECIRTAGGHRKFLMEHLVAFLEQNKQKTAKINLFPLETETDLQISQHILKGDFDYLADFVLTQALNGNRAQLQKVLNGLYLGQYPLHLIYDQLLAPVLHRIGALWHEQQISIIEEHFASQAIRDCITRLQGIIRIPEKKIATVLCLNFSHELHDIALKMVDHILESLGYEVLFSGQITPLLDIETIFARLTPQRVYLSSTMIEDVPATQAEFEHIGQLCQKYGTRLFLGGQGFDRLDLSTYAAIQQRLFSFTDVYQSAASA